MNLEKFELDDEIRMSELSRTVTHGEVLKHLKGRARYDNRLVQKGVRKVSSGVCLVY